MQLVLGSQPCYHVGELELVVVKGGRTRRCGAGHQVPKGPSLYEVH